MSEQKDIMNETFKKNFLKSVAYEIRFTPVLIIVNKLSEFQEKIRERIPYLEETFPIGQNTIFANEWILSDKKGIQIKITIDKLAILHNAYSSFIDFLDITNYVFSKFFEFFKINSFIRVGLRFINDVPLKKEEPQNQQILKWFKPIVDKDALNNLNPFLFNVELRRIMEGTINITKRNVYANTNDGNRYIIDIDISKTNVDNINYEELLKKFHQIIKKEFFDNVTLDFISFLRQD